MKSSLTVVIVAGIGSIAVAIHLAQCGSAVDASADIRADSGSIRSQ